LEAAGEEGADLGFLVCAIVATDKSMTTSESMVLFMPKIIVATVKLQQMIENIGEILVSRLLRKD
jgi:hypothetical protein